MGHRYLITTVLQVRNEYVSKYVISFISEYAPIFTGKESFYGSMMRSSPMGILLPTRFPGVEKMLERIWNFKPRKDDIWIVTYAKSGTTLTQVNSLNYIDPATFSHFSLCVLL